MDKNEINTVYDVLDVLGAFDEELDDITTMVVHSRDNSTNWIDTGDNPEALVGLGLAKVISTLGLLTIDNWDEVKDCFPEDVRDRAENAVSVFQDLLDQLDQLDDNEE
ncbi:MAG: hypothetical protein RSD95_07745 [Clostridia bacterium]